MESRESRRILIVAHKSVATPALVDAVRRRNDAGPCTFALLIPDASNPVADAWTARRARRVLSKATGALVESTLVEGDDAFAGVASAVGTAHYDEILLSLLPDSGSRWAREDLPARVEALGIPVTIVTAEAVTA